jgi:hypothetical protein
MKLIFLKVLIFTLSIYVNNIKIKSKRNSTSFLQTSPSQDDVSMFIDDYDLLNDEKILNENKTEYHIPNQILKINDTLKNSTVATKNNISDNEIKEKSDSNEITKIKFGSKNTTNIRTNSEINKLEESVKQNVTNDNNSISPLLNMGNSAIIEDDMFSFFEKKEENSDYQVGIITQTNTENKINSNATFTISSNAEVIKSVENNNINQNSKDSINSNEIITNNLRQPNSPNIYKRNDNAFKLENLITQNPKVNHKEEFAQIQQEQLFKKEKINKSSLINTYKPDTLDLSKLKYIDSIISNVY